MADRFRMPAEWEPHAATWIGWPHNKSDWPGKFALIPWVYAEIVRKLAPGELVRILVNSAAHEAQARRILTKGGVDAARLEFLRVPTDRGWIRDFGPIFVKRDRGLAIARFHFNAWAKYPDWKRDDKVPAFAAKRLKLRIVEPKADGQPVILEGGSIDVNGRGSLLTTEECLLHPTVQARNPRLHRADIEGLLHDYLGATNVEVVDLPMPAPVVFDGMRLPASYANFYVANAAVLVPTFNDPKDRVALGILGEVFSDRPVVGIHAVDLVWGLGTLHCLTQQQPVLTP